MITAIDHVELRVHDLDRALAFYTGPLGLEDHAPEGPMHFLGACGRSFLVLVAGRDQAEVSGALDHLAFSVPDVEAARETLAARGVVFDRHRTDGDGGGRSYYFRDPDGNALEIYGRLSGER